ncbi:MAG: 3-deoxy-D-manno-octulosonic acid transferase [Bdellovibrionota bacterium]
MTWRERLYDSVIRLVVRSASPLLRHHPRLRERFSERYGYWNLNTDSSYIWIHGASAGELRGLVRLIPWIRRRYPDGKILITSFSLAGITAHESEADEARLITFDSAPWIERALGGVQIRLFLFGEMEIWPLLISKLAQRNIPICMVNARVETRNIQKYRRFSFLFPSLFSQISKVLVVSESMKERFISLGVPRARVQTTGNTKYDREPLAEDDIGAIRALCDCLPQTRIITLGSVHPGEEAWWLNQLVQRGALAGSSEQPLLVIVPRHLEKIEYFQEQLKARGLAYECSSKIMKSPKARASVLLVDEFGVLEKYYAVSDFAFIGGTLVAIGGHNPFEPAPYRIPIGIGPHTSKIVSEMKVLKEYDAFIEIKHESDVAGVLNQVVSQSADITSKGDRLFQAWMSARGAVQKVEHALNELLETPDSFLHFSRGGGQ